MKKYFFPLVLLAVFEAVAVVLWLTRDNLFYLFNFSYIGVSVSLGVFLFVKKYRHARRIVQLLVGLYMLVYLGLICGENMQIEGFWYYLFTGVFEAATIHYAVAKIFGPLLFGRGWCGYACWTAMVLDFLPFKVPGKPENERERGERWSRRNIGWMRYVMFAISLIFVAALIRVKCDESKCISCGKCRKVCPMEVDMLDPSKRRKNGTECILCLECKRNCPVDAL